MEENSLVHRLQQRLSQTVSAEVELKRELTASLEKEKILSDEILRLEGECRKQEEAVRRLREEQYHSDENREAVLRILTAMPLELEKLIGGLEDNAVDLQTVGGVLVWMEMTMRDALGHLQETSISSKGLPRPTFDALKALELKNSENEAVIESLKERESELGSRYDALLLDYDDLRRRLPSIETESASEGGSCLSLKEQAVTDGEQDIQVASREMTAYDNDQIGDGNDEGAGFPAASGIVGAEKRQMMQRCLDRVTMETNELRRKLRSRGKELVEMLSEARGEQHRLFGDLTRLDRSFSPDQGISDATPASGQLHPEPQDVSVGDGSYEWETKYRSVSERLISMNGRCFDLLGPIDRPTDTLIHTLNLETRDLHRPLPTGPKPSTQDDLYLHRLKTALSEDGIRRLKINARAMKMTRQQLDHLIDGSELEVFILTEQEHLLTVDRSEINRRTQQQQDIVRQIESLTESLEDHQVMLEGLQRDVDIKEQQCCSLGQNLETIQQEIVRLKEREVQSTAEHLKLSNAQSCILQEKDDIRLALHRLQQETNDKSANLSKEKEEMHLLEQQRRRLEDRIEVQSTDLRNLNREKAALNVSCKEQSDLLSSKSSEAKCKVEDIKQLKKRQKELDLLLKSTDQKYELLLNIEEQKSKTVDGLRSSVERRRSRREAAEREKASGKASCIEDGIQESAERNEDRSSNVPPTFRDPCSISWSSRGIDGRNNGRRATPASLDGMSVVEEVHGIWQNQQYSRASASGDLLIRCLEDELKKQQEQNDRQKQTIQQLTTATTNGIAPAEQPEEEDTCSASVGVRNLQIGLKHALDEMNKLYENMRSIQSDVPSTDKPYPRRRASYSCILDRSSLPASIESKPLRKTPSLILKTRGQMRSELAAAEKQLMNLEEKLKDVIGLSSMKDRLIVDLQKRISTSLHVQNLKRSQFWRY